MLWGSLAGEPPKMLWVYGISLQMVLACPSGDGPRAFVREPWQAKAASLPAASRTFENRVWKLTQMLTSAGTRTWVLVVFQCQVRQVSCPCPQK